MKKEMLVIIPAYNEEKNIAGVVNELKKDLPYADILVINDNSSDDTLEVLKTLDVEHVTTPFNLKYSGVIQAGFKYALSEDYKYVAQFDGDGQHIAKELDKMYRKMIKNNADIIIGSRFIKETFYKHSFFRKVGTNIFTNLIKLICKQTITDPTSGLQILSKDVYSRYSKMTNYPEFPDANLIMEMLIYGYKIDEYGVEMRERIYGESMHAGIIGPFVYMIRMFYSILLILFKYPSLKNARKVMSNG